MATVKDLQQALGEFLIVGQSGSAEPKPNATAKPKDSTDIETLSPRLREALIQYAVTHDDGYGAAVKAAWCMREELCRQRPVTFLRLYLGLCVKDLVHSLNLPPSLLQDKLDQYTSDARHCSDLTVGDSPGDLFSPAEQTDFNQAVSDTSAYFEALNKCREEKEKLFSNYKQSEFGLKLSRSLQGLASEVFVKTPLTEATEDREECKTTSETARPPISTNREQQSSSEDKNITQSDEDPTAVTCEEAEASEATMKGRSKTSLVELKERIEGETHEETEADTLASIKKLAEAITAGCDENEVPLCEAEERIEGAPSGSKDGDKDFSGENEGCTTSVISGRKETPSQSNLADTGSVHTSDTKTGGASNVNTLEDTEASIKKSIKNRGAEDTEASLKKTIKNRDAEDTDTSQKKNIENNKECPEAFSEETMICLTSSKDVESEPSQSSSAKETETAHRPTVEKISATSFHEEESEPTVRSARRRDKKKVHEKCSPRIKLFANDKEMTDTTEQLPGMSACSVRLERLDSGLLKLNKENIPGASCGRKNKFGTHENFDSKPKGKSTSVRSVKERSKENRKRARSPDSAHEDEEDSFIPSSDSEESRQEIPREDVNAGRRSKRLKTSIKHQLPNIGKFLKDQTKPCVIVLNRLRL